MTGTGDRAPDEHAYFQAIEEKLVELNGAPRVLLPRDFQLACSWQRDGIPLDLVLRLMEKLVAQRKRRGERGHVSSLRYFASAIQAASSERR